MGELISLAAKRSEKRQKSENAEDAANTLNYHELSVQRCLQVFMSTSDYLFDFSGLEVNFPPEHLE